MRNYASKQAKKGKLAFRTPDRFIYKMVLKTAKKQYRQKKRFYKD